MPIHLRLSPSYLSGMGPPISVEMSRYAQVQTTEPYFYLSADGSPKIQQSPNFPTFLTLPTKTNQ